MIISGLVDMPLNSELVGVTFQFLLGEISSLVRLSFAVVVLDEEGFLFESEQ